MLHKIKENLDKHLGFNSDELFIDDMVRVFGGAIRDSIADMPIKDIDILCGPLSCRKLETILETNGYKYLPSVLSSYEIGKLYAIQNVISEPKTFIKGFSVVQLIRPRPDFTKEKYFKEIFVDLIANVDISCCGVSWDGDTLYENYPCAVQHAKSMVFTVNHNAKMYVPDRIIHRTSKLVERGWQELIDTKSNIRDFKINQLFNNNINFNYVREYDRLREHFKLIQ